MPATSGYCCCQAAISSSDLGGTIAFFVWFFSEASKRSFHSFSLSCICLRKSPYLFLKDFSSASKPESSSCALVSSWASSCWVSPVSCTWVSSTTLPRGSSSPRSFASSLAISASSSSIRFCFLPYRYLFLLLFLFLW